MGGLGKTAIAKKVYEDPEVKQHFEHHAWIRVTQNFNAGTILKALIKEFFNEHNQSVPPIIKETEHLPNLKMKVMKILKNKRYLIVFDDIWSIHAWDAVQIAFPNDHCGSRVLVTTRSSDLASHLTKSFGHIYNLAPLPDNESLTLFCQEAFGKNYSGLPKEFMDLSKDILSKCAGLPLGIVSIAGLLATKGLEYMEWEMIYRSLGEEIKSNNMLENMKKILMVSFTDLPYNLKACFMYIGLFPERRLIKCKKLIRLWIAEGFVEEADGKTIEEVSESFLKKLIKRNLLQVAVRDRGGEPKKCQIHDLMREIIHSKCYEDQFGAVVTDSSRKVCKKFRRLSIQDYGNSAVVLQDDYNLFCNRIRSFFLFRISKSSGSPIQKNFFTGFRLLRVIDLKAQPLELFPSEFLNLFHLRYLGLRRTKIKMLPNSIGKLQNLETLDLKHSEVSELPDGIFTLHKLRYLLIHRYNINAPYSPFNFSKGFTTKVGISSLKSLQKLSFIEVNQGQEVIKELGRLKQLQRLGIGKLTKEDGKHMCSSLEELNKLRSLTVSAREEDDFLDLESLSSPRLLQRLALRGTMAKLPSWISSLRHLVRISLKWARLNESPLKSLQELPALMDLDLYNAFTGDLLCFEAGGFPKLNMLNLSTLEGLKGVDFKEGAVIQLQKLYIVCCVQLQNVPFGIEHLTNLNDLRFYDMSEEFIKRVQHNQRIKHIPEIHALVWKSKWEYIPLVSITHNFVDGEKSASQKYKMKKH